MIGSACDELSVVYGISVSKNYANSAKGFVGLKISSSFNSLT